MNIGDRINLLLAKKNLTQAQVADAIKVTRQAMSFWCTGRSFPTGQNLMKLAQFFGVNHEWLKTGETNQTEKFEEVRGIEPEEMTPEGFVAIPEYQLVFSCGGGAEPPRSEFELRSGIKPAYYRREFFIERHLNPAKCKRATVDGDSMEPVLFDGDKVLFVEENQPVRIKDGAVYAISYFGDLKMKRLFQKANGEIVIHSDNPQYADETVSLVDQDALRIYGRVIDKSGSGGL